MFVLSLSLKQLSKRSLLKITCIILLLMTLTAIILAFFPRKNYACHDGEVYSVRAETQNDISKFARFFGLSPDFSSEKSYTVTIPAKFDTLFSRYEMIQNTVGLSLSPYAGKECTLHTWKLMNNNSSDASFLRLIIYDKKIIGGDICPVQFGSKIKNFAGEYFSLDKQIEL